jgi:hypothetical protein
MKITRSPYMPMQQPMPQPTQVPQYQNALFGRLTGGQNQGGQNQGVLNGFQGLGGALSQMYGPPQQPMQPQRVPMNALFARLMHRPRHGGGMLQGVLRGMF